MVTYFETYLISAYLNMNNFSLVFLIEQILIQLKARQKKM